MGNSKSRYPTDRLVHDRHDPGAIQGAGTGKPVKTIDPALIEFLETYSFPGNESELRDIIATAVLREAGGVGVGRVRE